MTWTRLLKRVLDIDIEHCPMCGGSLKIITAIEEPPLIVRILAIWVCPLVPRRARLRAELISFKWPESRNRLRNASRRSRLGYVPSALKSAPHTPDQSKRIRTRVSFFSQHSCD